MRHKRILKNTLLLYVRQVLVICVNLYALRIVLNALGVDDYGTFTVVAGFVTLLSFLPGTMASATQRFFSFALGQNDAEKLKKIFSVNWVLYAFFALSILLILETAGFWYVSNYLTIPADRIVAAKLLYHYIVFSFVLSVFSSPFMAIIIAYEDMHLYALLSIVEAVLKLSAAVLLVYLPWDSLPLYGQLLLIVATVNTVLYVFISVKKYSECQFKKLYWDTVLAKELFGFTGWTMFGQISTVCRYQAVTILLNQFFNPATVAARAIAISVSNQVMVFARHFNTSLYPPIIKTYAEDQKKEMMELILNGSKLSFFLMWIFALPLLLEMETVLSLWLKTPPEMSVLFTRLAIVEALILSLSLPIATAARAPGRMKLYELSLGSVQFLTFLASWMFLAAGYPAATVFIVAIVANVVMFKIRLLIVNRLVGFPRGLAPYYRSVLLPIIAVVLVSSLPTIFIRVWLPASFGFIILVIVCSFIFSTVGMYYLGLDRVWRQKSKDILFNRLARLRCGL